MATEKKKKDKTFNWVGFIGLLLLVYFLYDQCDRHEKDKQGVDLVMALQDSLQTWKTKDSLNKARISTMETETADQFLKIKSKDSTIIRLQKIIAEKKDDLSPGSSVTTGTTETSGQGTSGETEIVYVERDTLPTYFNKFDFGGWIWGSSTATKDSTTYDFNIRNEFDLVIGEEKTGFMGMGKPKPYVEMTNYNPYTNTTDLRTYRVSSPKPYNLVVGPALTYGWGGWSFGLSATYPAFKFRL